MQAAEQERRDAAAGGGLSEGEPPDAEAGRASLVDNDGRSAAAGSGRPSLGEVQGSGGGP